MNHSKSLKSIVLVLFLFSLALFTQPVLAKAKRDKQFAKTMQEFKEFYKKNLEEVGIIGSTFMFIHDNEVLAKEFYGLANIEQNRKVDENTIYHWASITKTFTGIAIMQLRDRGLLELDDPIIKYIPELRQVYNPFGDTGKITLRHLMAHTAGFRSPTFPWKEKEKPWHPHEPLHWEQLVAMFPYTEVLFEPGSRWGYSNPGIVFLGRVIELLTTDDWEVYIDKNIFKPLGMHRSYFDTTPYHLMKDKSQSYDLKEGKLTPADPDVNTGITVSNGGWKCPFPDFIKYMNFFLGNPQKQKVYDMVLKRSSLEEMWQPQVEIMSYDRDSRGEGRKDYMGLTFFIEDNYGTRFIAHSGGQNAFVTHFYIHPDTKTGYVVGYNTLAMPKDKDDPRSTRLLDRKIKDYLFKNIFSLFSKKK